MNSELLPVENGGFQSVPIANGAGELSLVAREQTEIQSAIIVAKKFPRDEAACYAKVIKSCERPLMAESAQYQFPRGKTKVTGPSVDLARELARCWGNIRYGLRLISNNDELCHIRGYALDLETNAYIEQEDQFAPKIQRKNSSGVSAWVKADERDLRELIAKRGAILVRNAILQLVPPDVVDAALEKAQDTMKRAARGELTQNREDAIRRLVLAFDRVSVTSEMLQRKLGHELSLISEDELVELRAIWKSLHDGNSRREEHFDVKRDSSDETKGLNDLINQSKPKEANAAGEKINKGKVKGEEKPTGASGAQADEKAASEACSEPTA